MSVLLTSTWTAIHLCLNWWNERNEWNLHLYSTLHPHRISMGFINTAGMKCCSSKLLPSHRLHSTSLPHHHHHPLVEAFALWSWRKYFFVFIKTHPQGLESNPTESIAPIEIDPQAPCCSNYWIPYSNYQILQENTDINVSLTKEILQIIVTELQLCWGWRETACHYLEEKEIVNLR